jgi:sugar phosphate permease
MIGSLVALALLVLAYDAVIRTNAVASVLVLGAIGALIFGPQVLLVGTTPVDMARRGAAAAACGFVNFFGYLGAAAGDQVTGYLVDQSGWQAKAVMRAQAKAGWAHGVTHRIQPEKRPAGSTGQVAPAESSVCRPRARMIAAFYSPPNT